MINIVITRTKRQTPFVHPLPRSLDREQALTIFQRVVEAASEDVQRIELLLSNEVLATATVSV